MTLIYIDSWDPSLANSFDGITNGSVTFVDTSPGEDLHHLDLLMDRQKPHWNWINETLSLYRTSTIYSNGQFKFITDRADLPTRMVFGPGNMIEESWNLQVTKDPLQVNQCVVEFSNQQLDYERDVLYIQNSATAASNVPIKPFNLDLVGVSRRNEAIRAASLEMQRRNVKQRAITFETDIEAVPLEPGDVFAAHIPSTDFTMGTGGRLLDGSTVHAVLDRELQVKSGNTYEIYVWHTDADTVERAPIVSSPPGFTITVTPIGGFQFPARPGETYAVGVTSRDVLLFRTVQVGRAENGRHTVKGQEYLRLQYQLDCPGTPSTAYLLVPPSQPTSVSVVVSACTVTVGSFVYVTPQSGQFSQTGSGQYLWTGNHNPNLSAMIGDSLSITTGVASGFKTSISSWYPSSGPLAFITTTPVNASNSPVNPASGDRYLISLNASISGFQLRSSTDGVSYSGVGFVGSTTGQIDITGFGFGQTLMIVPVNSRGYTNENGSWTLSRGTPNCGEFETVTTAQTVTTSAVFVAVVLPGSTLGTRNRLDITVNGLISETCGAGATTNITFSMVYGSLTALSLPAITINGGGGTSISDASARIEAKVFASGASKQAITMEYAGVSDGNAYTNVGAQGVSSINSTLAQTLAFAAAISHTGGAGCYSFSFQDMEIEVTSL